MTTDLTSQSIVKGCRQNKSVDQVRKLKAIVLATLLLIVGIQLLSALWWQLFSTGDVLEINNDALGTAVLIFSGFGIALSLIISRICPDWSDSESKKVAFGAITGTFFTKTLTCGACIPAALFGTLGTVPMLILTLFGASVGKLYRNFCSGPAYDKKR